jgi:holo-[acyl-carrier protein] synthase
MRIGCDLVLISRIAKLSQNEGFLRKVFHEDELAYCRGRGVGCDSSLAARFAAKEAFAKALGTGLFSQGVNPTEMWIVNDEYGRPLFQLSSAMSEKVREFGYSSWDVSLSHQGDYAMATVLLF